MRRIAAVGLLVLIAGLSGCGTKKVSVRGTVTRSGAKLTWPEGGYLSVIFFPENRERNPNVYKATATDLENSTYEVEAIPPGRYRVSVEQFDLKHNDALGRQFDPFRTPLYFDVPAEGGVIDIDVPLPVQTAGNRGFGGGKGGFGRKGPRKGGDPPAEPDKGKEEPARPEEKKGDSPAADDNKIEPPRLVERKD